MKDGNFNLRKWNSNSRELTELIKKEEQADEDIPKVSEEDETYARTNLGDKIVVETTERKVLSGTISKTILSLKLTFSFSLQENCH